MATACTDFEQDLVLYHYRELNSVEAARIADHMRRCAACAAFVDELARLLPLTVEADRPDEDFWRDYSREMRHKLADLQEKSSWRQLLQSLLQPWALSAVAATVVVALTVSLTLDRRPAPYGGAEEQALLEVMPLAENLEFFDHLDVLENIELLELMGSTGNSAV